MKIASSLKSLKKRDLNSKLVKRRGKLYVINKKNPRFKARQGQEEIKVMDEEDYKSTWKGFTKLVLWSTLAVIAILVILALTLL